LAQDVFITDLSEKFAELRRQIQEDTQRLLQPMQHELDSEISKTKEIVQTVRTDNLKAVEEIRRLRSMEQHKQLLQAYPTPIDKDVFETEIKRVTEAIEGLSDAVASVKEEVSSMKEANDVLPPSRGISFRRGRSPTEAAHLAVPGNSNLDDTLQSIRDVLSEMDFTDMLNDIKRSIPADEFRMALTMVQEQMVEVFKQLRAVQEEVQNRPNEVDFTPVLDAFASSPLHDILEVKSSLEQAKVDMAKNTEHLAALWSQLPPVDFAPVFDCVRANRVEVDMSPVLTAVQEVNVKENMQQQFGEILAEINHRQSNLDFSELLESIKASKMKVDFNGVIASINDSCEEVGNLITELKPSLSNLEQSNASMLERLQELQQVQDKGVLTGIAGLKDWTERLAQKFSILLQTISEKEDQEVKVNFTPVLEAIERNKVHIDFSPILASIKKNCDFSDVTEDMARVLKTIQEMKVQVDFTPVLRAVREGKQETVFELLSAFRDQCTDNGELNDNIVQLRESTQTNLKQLKESMEKESKEALTSEVLRSIREKEVRIDIEIKKALEQNNDLAEKGASEMQAKLEEELRSLRDSVTKELKQNETRGTAESQKLEHALRAIEVRPQVTMDLAPVSKLVEEIQVQLHRIDQTNVHLTEVVQEQAHGQENLQEALAEASDASQRQCESVKSILREKMDNVIQSLTDDDAKKELSKEQLHQIRSLAQAIQQRPTTEELDHRLTSLLEGMQDNLQQSQTKQQELLLPPVDFKREISDAVEAAAEQMVDKNSIELLLREQLQRYKKDLQSTVEATLNDQHSKDKKDLESSLGEIQKQQEAFLAQLQEQQHRPEMLQALEDHLQGSFAQVLSEIRSQQSGDLTPILTGLRETQELTQGVSNALRAWRAASSGGQVETGASTEIGPQSWEWQEFLSKILSDHFNHQLQQLQEILGDRQLVDLSQVTGALHSWVTEHGDFQLALREMEQLRRGELQQNPSSPYAISIRNDLEGSPSNVPDRSVSAAAERESREILAAIRELQRNLDLSHEFSAVIAAVQEKDVKHTPVLVALQEQKTDINAQFDDLREMLRQGPDRPRSSASRKPQAKAERTESTADSQETFKLTKILDAIKDQKVSIDFSVAQVLNNIQQKQQETIDKLILTDQQLDFLKQGLSKLNGQDTLGRIRTAAPAPSPASPRMGQWQLPGSPWIPPGILGLDK